MRPRQEVIREAGQALATARRIADEMGPRELAEAIWRHGMDKTVDDLENEIRTERGLPLRQAS